MLQFFRYDFLRGKRDEKMPTDKKLRDTLIQNTIHLIAEGGFEKATTKAITYCCGDVGDVKLNEVYIYRLFGSKAHLYEEAFELLDKEFVRGLRVSFGHIHHLENNPQEKLYMVFQEAWHFALQNEENCRYYLRFYYSVYFQGDVIAKHNKLFQDIVAEFQPLFKEGADAYSVMHCVLTLMLDFAVRVYNGELADNDVNRPHIFNVLYSVMLIYFREDLQPDRI